MFLAFLALMNGFLLFSVLLFSSIVNSSLSPEAIVVLVDKAVQFGWQCRDENFTRATCQNMIVSSEIRETVARAGKNDKGGPYAAPQAPAEQRPSPDRP